MDGRKQNLFDIRSILTVAAEKVDALLDSRFFEREFSNEYPGEYRMRLEQLQMLRDGLEGCKIGLQNLKTTYAGDATIVAELDMLCIKVSSLTRRMDAKLNQVSYDS